MNDVIVHTVADLQVLVKACDKLHVIGQGTKTGLVVSAPDVTRASLTGLVGITEYQPAEYTITIQAGTPIRVIADTMRQNGQYLPFDPMLANSATIGGTVAANLSGSRRWRYGGIRDFILGAQVVDGLGRAFRVGSKVVKNAAGFDLPKFLVGSLGRYLIITELTFKVFPDAPTYNTFRLIYSTLDQLLSAVYVINQSEFEVDALDFEPQDEHWLLWARMTGSADTLPERTDRLIKALHEKTSLINASASVEDSTVWDVHNELAWAQDRAVVKVVVSPKQVADFDRALATAHIARRYSAGGNVAWAATNEVGALAGILDSRNLTGLCVIGKTDTALLGKAINNPLSDRIKQVLDPENKLV